MFSLTQLRSRKAVFTPAILLVVGLLVLSASGQNVINTIAGGGAINSNPLLAAVPGPTGIAEDTKGNLYVIAPLAQQVFELSSGTASVFAGAGYLSYHPSGGSWNGPALNEPMNDPFGLTVDAQGNLYIADTYNNVIRCVLGVTGGCGGSTEPVGTIITVAGNHVKPCGGLKCGDGGPATAAELNEPQGVAVDTSGNIYIADTGDNRVRCVIAVLGGCGNSAKNLPVGTIVAYAGNLTSCAAPTDPCGDGGSAKAANLNSPMGIALDGKGNLYIADTWDNRIRLVNTKHIINTIAGTGNQCYGGSCGDTGSALSANLARPRGVSVDASDNFYIADTLDNRIRCVLGATGGCGGDQTDPVGTIIAFAGNGSYGFSGDSGSPIDAQMALPNGVLVDKSGNVFAADTDNERIREVTGGLSGVINTIMGGGGGGDNGSPTAATLANPHAVVVDSSNNYYIADSADNRIRVVNVQTSQITVAGVVVQPGQIATIAGNGDVGWLGDTGPATLANLDSPLGVTVDLSGNIYIADTSNGEVRCVLNVVGGCGGSTEPVGTIITFAGTGGSCSGTNACGDNGPATEAQLVPSTLAVDSSGNVYIADAWDNRIRCVLGVTGGCGGSTQPVGYIVTVAGTGANGYSGDGGPAIAAELSRPFGIALDAFDNLYIADANNNVVRCVLGVAEGCADVSDPVGTIVTYVYDGGEGYCCHENDLWRLDASRWAANTVAVDSRGNLFIGGGQYNLVQRVDLATGTIYTVAGNDRRLAWGLYGDGGPATNAELDNVGQAIDSNENLLIADAGNNRIRVVPLVPVVTFSPTSLNFGDQTVGQPSQPLTVTLQNTGADDLLTSSIAVSGDFALSNNTCPSSPSAVAPTLSCTISVTFTPTKTGTRTGYITVTDNGYKSPQKVKLTGIGR